jgi:hypothetical protein
MATVLAFTDTDELRGYRLGRQQDGQLAMLVTSTGVTLYEWSSTPLPDTGSRVLNYLKQTSAGWRQSGVSLTVGADGSIGGTTGSETGVSDGDLITWDATSGTFVVGKYNAREISDRIDELIFYLTLTGRIPPSEPSETELLDFDSVNEEVLPCP